MICLQTERALARYLLGNASWLVTGAGTFIVEEKGLRIRLQNGFGYFLPVVPSQNDTELGGPAVVAACPSATQAEPGSLTHIAEVEVALRFPADEGTNQRNALDAFMYAVGQLQAALYRDDLPQLVSLAGEGFTCLWAPGAWVQSSGWIDRLRTYQFKRQLLVASAEL